MVLAITAGVASVERPSASTSLRMPHSASIPPPGNGMNSPMILPRIGAPAATTWPPIAFQSDMFVSPLAPAHEQEAADAEGARDRDHVPVVGEPGADGDHHAGDRGAEPLL